jgi:hypothetical protein
MRLTPARTHAAARSGVTSSGFASSVTSAPGERGNASINRAMASGDSSEGVPPPRYTVSNGPGTHPSPSLRIPYSASTESTKGSDGTARRTAMAKSQ